MPNKPFTIKLYEGGWTSSNQTAVTIKTTAVNKEEAVKKALVEYPGSIVVQCSEGTNHDQTQS